MIDTIRSQRMLRYIRGDMKKLYISLGRNLILKRFPEIEQHFSIPIHQAIESSALFKFICRRLPSANILTQTEIGVKTRIYRMPHGVHSERFRIAYYA